MVALLLIVAFAGSGAYTMTSLARMSQDTGAQNFGELWSLLISKETKWIADMSIFTLCFGCCVFYSAFIGDIFNALSSALGASGLLTSRSFLLSLITAIVIIPLCLTEDLSSLQFSSLLGVGGVFVTLAFLLKCLFDGSYAIDSPLVRELATKLVPSWPTPKIKLFAVNSGSLVLVNMLCVAFLAHYNAINYYKELKNRSLRRYSVAIVLGYGFAVAVFIAMMCSGYLLFGASAQPLILNNFHRSKDIFASLARMATGLAIVFAYPLMFAGLKSSLYNLVPSSWTHSKSKRDAAAVTVAGLR